ncbi:DUF402 domain-containing protein [Nocardia arthritidis]|uniref:DUF402 domain-containing protein n=1 Tax=Nocardia arthritidis TaxID=228602 RepID=A0A6G9YCW2_9NOCA|nr:DUF402 domain-containing protein [Nocardia arthritidis]QIS11115.1 DUF402 domain-containing protein [Nocardia arthritidis]
MRNHGGLVNADPAPVHVHRPKVEYFDLAGLTNTDPKGFVRPVETYRVESWGLYMARTSDHPQFHYIESWLLPELSLRATVFHYHPAHQRDQDYYLDLGEYTRLGPKQWKSVDHYLDIVVRSGRETELLDVDELLAAHAAGLIGAAEAEAAVANAATAIDGIAANGHSLESWMESMGITLTWM